MLLSTWKFEIISIWKLFLKVQAKSQPQIVSSEKKFSSLKWLIFESEFEEKEHVKPT